MIRTVIFILVSVVTQGSIIAQSRAAARAGRMGLGMNLSYLDNFWLGTRQKHFSDFAKPAEAAKREQMLGDIAKAGFKTVRVPICFSAWANLESPYHWETLEGIRMADNFVSWALDNRLNVIVDLHHPEFDGKVVGAAETKRIVWLWQQITQHYKGADPEHVFFEIRNEPHEISAGDWRSQAEEVINAIRAIDTRHTLIVGFHDWNSRQALIDSKPFEDPNIIYTFHYYDPFAFTHQGATWTSEGMGDLHPVPFPGSASDVKVPEAAKGKWVETLVKNYGDDSREKKMFADLKMAKDWSEKYGVPIFLGEFGSFGKYPTMQDRCRHAAVVYAALGKLKIPNAWWEWDGGFNMFDSGTTKISECMRRAIDSYYAAANS